MTSPFDETEFIDRDVPGSASPHAVGTSVAPALPAGRPPTREELDARAGETQNRIAELRRAQEELERQRLQIEEARRRRSEFEAGRVEMVQHLSRGIGLLEEAEFKARRDAEQMARTLADFRDALAKVQAIQEDRWTQDDWNQELTRALTTVENARMEWNSARLKLAVLNGDPSSTAPSSAGATASPDWLAARSLGELCRAGLALTWPLAVVGVVASVLLTLLLLRR